MGAPALAGPGNFDEVLYSAGVDVHALLGDLLSSGGEDGPVVDDHVDLVVDHHLLEVVPVPDVQLLVGALEGVGIHHVTGEHVLWAVPVEYIGGSTFCRAWEAGSPPTAPLTQSSLHVSAGLALEDTIIRLRLDIII